MDLKHEGFDVILTHGPPFVGKERYCRDRFSQTHKIIVPRNLYKEHSKFGIRDVALEVYKNLKEGNKVVVLDTNENRKTRESYIKLLKKKFNDLSVATVSILPQYGCQQLFWMRELYMARETQHEGAEDSQCDDDERILKWFEKSSDTAVTYKYGTADAPRESEGSYIHHEVHGLQASSTYKFNVAALFVQWECLDSLQHDEDAAAVSNILDIFTNWAKANPCGRVIVVCDGSQIRTGEKSRAQQTSDIQECMNRITADFDLSPVYVYHIEKPLGAGSYVLPPNPGILAYLQNRHRLTLHSKQTVYMFETTAHMKMAERAGVRHVKSSRLIKHPSLITVSPFAVEELDAEVLFKSRTQFHTLMQSKGCKQTAFFWNEQGDFMVTSNHTAVVPPVPEMLRHLTVEPEKEPQSSASIPLYTKADNFKEGRIRMSLGYGRSEFIFAKDWQVVERYQKQYASKAKRVGESDSAVSPYKPAIDDESESSPVDTGTSHRGHSLTSRDLPKWMMPREESGSSRSSLNSSLSTESSVSERKVRRSVYVMSEKELVEMATEILCQAGKSDVIENIQTEEKSRRDSSERQKDKTVSRKIQHKTPETRNPEILESPSSICPKMEIDNFDEYDESQCVDIQESPRKKVKLTNPTECRTGLKQKSESKATNKKEINIKNKKLQKVLVDVEDEDDAEDCAKQQPGSKLNVKRSCRSAVSKEIASSVLDDFIDITEQRKPSPKKITEQHWLSDRKRNPSGLVSTKSADTKFSSDKRKKSRQTPDLSVLDDIFL